MNVDVSLCNSCSL